MDFKKYLSGKSWRIEEKSFDPTLQNIRETLFTLGNGYLGMRGIYEEIPFDTLAGTYIAGVFDSSMSQVTELVNSPNPINFKVMADGEKLDVKAMKIARHCRILDMKHALLARRTVFYDRHDRRFEFRSLRFASAADPHLGVMHVTLKALDAPAALTVQTIVDTSVTNPGVLSEGRKTHFRTTTVDTGGDVSYREVETFTSRIRIGYATLVVMNKSGRKKTCPERTFRIRLKKGQEVEITKYFSIFTSRDVKPSKVRPAATQELEEAVRRGFAGCLRRHFHVWDRLWNDADIAVEGDDASQKALRFNIYHLLISGNPGDERVSIGARTLSGDGYRGHVFWDVEIYMFPFFLFTWPEVARNLLRYRYLQLDQARRNAKALGYKGALFGWETADTGEDATPTWFKGLDYSIVKVETSIEHHLMADIAYAVDRYITATGDEECFSSWGAEILFETARFWASRVSRRKDEDAFDIRDVIGPDEFHVHVNNNAFTNYMARWNLERAYWTYQHLKAEHPGRFKKLRKRIGLAEKEVDGWLKVSRGIRIPTNKKGNIIEEFEGFFRKKRVRLTRLDDHFMPIFPNHMPVTELNKTQLIKQADVLLLFVLFPGAFEGKVVRNSFRYYDSRTTHKSSLSHGIHALAAVKAGFPLRAFQYFDFAVAADLKNRHGNSADGIHGGSLGASWQAAVCGFGGLEIDRERPWFRPHLPHHWKSMRFKVHWRKSVLDVFITRKTIRIKLDAAGESTPREIGVYDNCYLLKPQETLEVHRPDLEGKSYDLCKTVYAG